MRLDKWLKTVTVIGVTALAPAFCNAAIDGCVTGPVTSESFSPSYALRADDELKHIQEDAQRIADEASINHSPLKADFDDMNVRLQWLDSVQALIAPAQREATSEAAPLIASLANGRADDFSARAAALVETISSDEHIAKLEEHASYMRRNLGMPVIFGK